MFMRLTCQMWSYSFITGECLQVIDGQSINAVVPVRWQKRGGVEAAKGCNVARRAEQLVYDELRHRGTGATGACAHPGLA